MHTLRWSQELETWIVSFVSDRESYAIGYLASGQDAVDLVSCLNGGQPAVVTEHVRGRLGVTPGLSDAELMKQLTAEEAAV